eukprot:gene1601-12726_t
MNILLVPITKILILVCLLITTGLSIGAMIGVGFLGVDKKIGNDICQNSNFNNHRPIRANIRVINSKSSLIEEEYKINQTTVYKICSTYPSSGSTEPHKCYKVEHNVEEHGDFIGIYCGWSLLRMFHYYGVHPFLCLFSIVGIVWVVKDKSYWILTGISFTLLVFVGIGLPAWIFVTDVIDLYHSTEWCEKVWKKTLCNPVDFFPEIDQVCECANWPYVLAGPLGGAVVVLAWFTLFIVVCLRWYGYRYSGFFYVESTPKEKS